MAIVASQVGDSTSWELWNTKYGIHTDSGDEGYVTRTDRGWVLYSRGDIPTERGVFKTLDSALRAGGVASPRRYPEPEEVAADEARRARGSAERKAAEGKCPECGGTRFDDALRGATPVRRCLDCGHLIPKDRL